MKWLIEPRLFWLATIVVVAAFVLAACIGTNELVVRCIGLFLEVLGIGTVAWGIRDTRIFFGRPGLFALACAWLARFPRFRTNVVVGGAAITVSASMVAGRGYGWHGVGENATAEDRVKAIENNLASLDRRLNDAQAQLDREVRDLRDSLVQESNARALDDRQTLAKLEATETGGLPLSATGTLWLVVGLVFTTLADEIAVLLH